MTQWVRFSKFRTQRTWHEVEDHGDKFGPMTGRVVMLPGLTRFDPSYAGQPPFRISEIATNQQKDEINLALVRAQFRKALT